MKNILCYGDSNTYGFSSMPILQGGMPTRLEKNVRWTGRLQNALGSGYLVYEEGMPGRTTVFDDPTMASRNGLKHLECIFESCQPVDLIVIALGTNDVRFVSQPSEVADGMRRIVCQCRDMISCSFNPNAKILIVAPTKTEYLPEAFIPYIPEWCDMIDQLPMHYKALAEELGCYFASAHDWAEVSISDGIHLSEEGHRTYALEMEKVIRTILD